MLEKGVSMPRMIRSLVLLPVLAAVGVVVTGCESSSTGPQTTPSQYAGSYQGIVAGAGGSGTVAITVGQVSADLTRGPVLHAEGGNPDAVTVTLATATGSITLTGTISGNTATVTSTTPPATCTITFTTTGASGSCTEAPYGTLSLIAFVLVNGIEATVYCGTQSPGEFPAFSPNATLGAVVSGPNMYLVVAPPTGTPTLYSGTIAGNSVSLTSTSSGGAVYNGTVTGTASVSGTITSGGSWAVSNPCSQGALTVSTNAVTASSSVGSTTTITPAPITITNSGSSGSTLGVLGVGAATYSPSATSGWLQASLTSPTIVSGTLSLSITPPSGIAAGTYTAAVPVTASLGTGSPQTVTVTLTITSGVTITSSSPLSACVDLINCNNQLTATGGTGTITWSLAAGSTLPAWLTLTSGGLLTGTAPAGVVYPANAPLTFSVAASDGTTSSTKQFQIVVYANVTITSTSPLPTAYFGVPYSYQFTATGGPTSNYGWALSPGSGLPGWLSLSVSGVLSGTPPAGAATPVTFTIAVASGGSTAGLQVSLPITTSGALKITTTTLPQAAVGVAYNDVGVLLAATGGTLPYKWSVTQGTPPAGVTVTEAGLVYGTPTTMGPSTFTVTVTDASSPTAQTASMQYTLQVNPALAITSSNLPNAYFGASYCCIEGYQLTATGGPVTYLLCVVNRAGSIPQLVVAQLERRAHGSATGWRHHTGHFLRYRHQRRRGQWGNDGCQGIHDQYLPGACLQCLQRGLHHDSRGNPSRAGDDYVDGPGWHDKQPYHERRFRAARTPQPVAHRDRQSDHDAGDAHLAADNECRPKPHRRELHRPRLRLIVGAGLASRCRDHNADGESGEFSVRDLANGNAAGRYRKCRLQPGCDRHRGVRAARHLGHPAPTARPQPCSPNISLDHRDHPGNADDGRQIHFRSQLHEWARRC